jgi:hypothetical protein
MTRFIIALIAEAVFLLACFLMEDEIFNVALFIFMSVQELNYGKCNSRKRCMYLIAFQAKKIF